MVVVTLILLTGDLRPSLLPRYTLSRAEELPWVEGSGPTESSESKLGT